MPTTGDKYRIGEKVAYLLPGQPDETTLEVAPAPKIATNSERFSWQPLANTILNSRVFEGEEPGGVLFTLVLKKKLANQKAATLITCNLMMREYSCFKTEYWLVKNIKYKTEMVMWKWVGGKIQYPHENLQKFTECG